MLANPAGGNRERGGDSIQQEDAIAKAEVHSPCPQTPTSVVHPAVGPASPGEANYTCIVQVLKTVVRVVFWRYAQTSHDVGIHDHPRGLERVQEFVMDTEGIFARLSTCGSSGHKGNTNY